MSKKKTLEKRLTFRFIENQHIMSSGFAMHLIYGLSCPSARDDTLVKNVRERLPKLISLIPMSQKSSDQATPQLGKF